MKVSIDRDGGVVIPKELRDQLSLGSESTLVIEADGDGLRLTPFRGTARRARFVDGLPVVDAVPGLVTTDADVRRWRDDRHR